MENVSYNSALAQQHKSRFGLLDAGSHIFFQSQILLAAAQILDVDSFADHHMHCQLTLALHRLGLGFKQAA